MLPEAAAAAARAVSMAGRPGPPHLNGSSHSLASRSRVRDLPLLRWAHDPRMSGPYFALGRDLATLGLGAASIVGRTLLRGAAPPGSSHPRARSHKLDT